MPETQVLASAAASTNDPLVVAARSEEPEYSPEELRCCGIKSLPA